MHKFVRNLITEWRKLALPFSAETIVVAVSGGADSVSLLLALDELRRRKKLDLNLVVAHFDHGLRGEESRVDAEYVANLAERLALQCILGSGKVSRKGNIEANARSARYQFLTETAERVGAKHVLTAHTVNDQAETFLMNLLRGSGPDGLAGMSAIRLLDGESGKSKIQNLKSKIALVRPLLTWAKRGDTEEFCRGNGIEFRNDTMNDDTSFTRVRIRKELIPNLETYNPKIVETLAKTAALLRHESEPGAVATGFPKEGEKGGRGEKETADESGTPSLKTMRSLSQPELYAALRLWLKGKRGNLRSLQLKHIEAIERLIHSRKSGKIAELPNREAVVKRGGRLVFEKIRVEK
jgi:tRNA(Ile)-lysidine synthase